jgi:hypothetical protein
LSEAAWLLLYPRRALVRRCGACARDDCATTRKEGRNMKKREAVLREERKSADAQAVAPRDWIAMGARIRQWAMAAAVMHLAERAATNDVARDETRD